MEFVDERGLAWVQPANNAEASKLSRYLNAVKRYLYTGDARDLDQLRGQHLRTMDQGDLPFLTDREELERLGYAGELSFDDIYEWVS